LVVLVKPHDAIGARLRKDDATFGSQKESSELVSPLSTTSGIVPPLVMPGMSGAGCNCVVLGGV